MNASMWSARCLFVEFGQSSLRVLDAQRGLELPVERAETGQLTPAGKQALIAGLQGFQKQTTWHWRQRAICGLSARGVSLRRLSLPAASGNGELERLLTLQLEREFPLPPEALAWTYCRLPGHGASSGPNQDFLLAAVKRELLEECTEVLSQSGLNPVFTLAAVARTAACPPRPPAYAVLDLGRCQSELVSIEQGFLTTIRIVPWGGEDLTQAVQQRLGMGRDEAERRKRGLETASVGPLDHEVQLCVQAEAEKIAGHLGRFPLGQKLYLAGESSRCLPLAAALAKALGSIVECEPIEFQQGSGRSAATLGLQRLWTRNDGTLPLVFQLNHHASRSELAGPRTPWAWAVLACVLGLVSLTLRYAEPFFAQPSLARRVARISSQREGLPGIDHELSFLQYLETNQPPVIETLYLMANLAPTGARLDSASMTRRGDFSVRGSMANAEQTAEFRSKLVDSGFFNTVVLDELAPTPDRQKVTFRLTVQLKPAGERPPLPAAPPPSAVRAEAGGSGQGPGAGRPEAGPRAVRPR